MELLRDHKYVLMKPVKDIISRPPAWVYRWGITVVALCGTVLLFLAAVIPIRQEVEAMCVLEAQRVPVPLIATDDGRLISFKFKQNELIKAGDTILTTDDHKAVRKVLSSSDEGRVFLFNDKLSPGTDYKAGDTLLFILPGTVVNNPPVAVSKLSLKEITKINIGDPVDIALNSSADSRRFKGSVVFKSSVHDQHGRYYVKIKFLDKVASTADFWSAIPYGSRANMRIVYNSATLYHRFFD